MREQERSILVSKNASLWAVRSIKHRAIALHEQTRLLRFGTRCVANSQAPDQKQYIPVMSADDFGIESLAAYLHLDAQKVIRLAERGKLPGRKVAGQWRFSRAAVHHWLEDRIGLSDQDELAQMEDVFQRSAPLQGQARSEIAQMLPLCAIEIPLLARTRESVFTSMVDVADRTGWLWDPAKMVEAIRMREQTVSYTHLTLPTIYSV